MCMTVSSRVFRRFMIEKLSVKNLKSNADITLGAGVHISEHTVAAFGALLALGVQSHTAIRILIVPSWAYDRIGCA